MSRFTEEECALIAIYKGNTKGVTVKELFGVLPYSPSSEMTDLIESCIRKLGSMPESDYDPERFVSIFD